MEIDEKLYKALCTGRIYVQKNGKGEVICSNAEDPIFYDVPNKDTDIFWLKGRYYRKVDAKQKDITLYDDVSMQIMDKITGCYTKEALEAYVKAHQSVAPFLFAVCDIDNFKYVNDTYGHHYGDVVIGRIGTLLRLLVGEYGLACRWGGDEFVLILPEEKERKLEEIRLAVSNEIFPSGYSVTITIGATAYQAGESVEQAIKRADDSLYKGKKLGRNVAITDDMEEKNQKVLQMTKRPPKRTPPKAQNE